MIRRTWMSILVASVLATPCIAFLAVVVFMSSEPGFVPETISAAQAKELFEGFTNFKLPDDVEVAEVTSTYSDPASWGLGFGPGMMDGTRRFRFKMSPAAAQQFLSEQSPFTASWQEFPLPDHDLMESCCGLQKSIVVRDARWSGEIGPNGKLVVINLETGDVFFCQWTT